MLEAFRGLPPTAAHQAAHWNGDRSDNRLANLRWATAAENAADRARHGRSRGARPGSGHHNARLTDFEVAEIRRRAAGGERGKDLAEAFRVSRPTICDILKGRTWQSHPASRSLIGPSKA